MRCEERILFALLPVLNNGRRLAYHGRLALALSAQRAVARRHMGDLMRHDGGGLRSVAGKGEQSARHVKIA